MDRSVRQSKTGILSYGTESQFFDRKIRIWIAILKGKRPLLYSICWSDNIRTFSNPCLIMLDGNALVAEYGRVVECWVSNIAIQQMLDMLAQSRSQRPRYPCPADYWYRVTRALATRLMLAKNVGKLPVQQAHSTNLRYVVWVLPCILFRFFKSVFKLQNEIKSMYTLISVAVMT